MNGDAVIVRRAQRECWLKIAICRPLGRRLMGPEYARFRRYALSAAVLASFLSTAAFAGAPAPRDWPEFRGPAGQGIAADASPPLEWSPDKNIAWRREIPGAGWSSPSVYQGSIYLTSALLDEAGNPRSLRALRIDAETGVIQWNEEVFPWSGTAEKHPKNGYASPTPVVSEGRVYVHFGPLGTACLDTTGRVLWRQSGLPYSTPHGGGGSPVLAGGKLIYSCDGQDEPFVVALDAATGEVAWKAARDTGANNKFSFCTPTIIERAGQRVAVSPGSGYVGAYGIDDGTELWRVQYGEGFSVVPRPVVHGDLVYVTTGFARPSSVLAIRTGGQGDVTDSHVVWKSEKGTPHTPSMLVVGDALYFISDRGAFSCVDAETGQVHWQEDVSGRFSASLVSSAGRIYVTSEAGETFVVRAGKRFELLAENSLSEPTLASPAIWGRALFIRTEMGLYRIEEP